MSRTRRLFTREFKISIIRDLDAGKSLAQVARENAIDPSMISRWSREYYADPENAFQGNGRVYKEEARIAKLERLVGQLYAENELLKKALDALGKRSQEERRGGKLR